MAWEVMTAEKDLVVVHRYTWFLTENTDWIGGSVGSGVVFEDWTML